MLWKKKNSGKINFNPSFFSQGETIITQGESGDVLYVIEKGELDCYKTFVNHILIIVERFK